MKIKEKMEGDIAVLTVSGNMMGGPDSTVLHDKVKSLINDGLKRVVIDIKGVKWMNSSGLGILMACLSSLQSADGQLKLSSVTDKVKSVLMITKLIELFETYENAERAVAKFLEEEKKR
ncbi:MAG: STAS domain-containing protein [Calditrichaeota bacterium]|nr:STAS domain-containing protein [Calditrichota bacterium]MCB0296208.1 STAS domain-containing protein [Calditrichota bacterium]MCB0304350.1 STAS domain-containing protein [Calditrichota bacterium]MCB0312493.1 STAS domain-containing protein [Calditrichota bacterium]MCB9087142.1 STAS domain-containing protein [Calditrichia bacterium]